MLNVALLLGLALIYTFQSLFAKLFSDRYSGEERFSSPVFSVIYGLVIGLATLAINGFLYRPSTLTLIMGLLNGVIVFVYNLALIESSRRGPYSFVMICNLSGGLLMPLFALSILRIETLSLVRGIGVALMLCAFVLLNLKGEKQEKPQKGFYFWVILLCVVNGTFSVLLSLQTHYMSGAERSEMLVTTFLFSGIISAVYLAGIARKKTVAAFRMSWKALLFALGSCIAATAAANFVMYMYSIMSDTVVNATNQGGILVFSVLVSMILFRERMNWKQIVGSVVALVAVILLNL